jgi:hypothetical protein
VEDKIKELAMNSKNKNVRYIYRCINGFRRGYQPISNTEKDDKGEWFVHTHNILNRWKNNFSVIECA